VKWIEDGDTILVDIQGHSTMVHYLGIQSPDNLPNIQYLGPPAATRNAALVQGQVVQLVPDEAQPDQNGQLFRYVLIYNTQTFVNFELLRLGLAQTAPNSSSLSCHDTFTQVQDQARLAEMGLWAPSPTLFPSATLRPTRTATLIPTSSPTSAFSSTSVPSSTATFITLTPSSIPATPTLTPGTTTPSPSGTPPTATVTPLPSETQALPGQPSNTPGQTSVRIVNIFYHGNAANESDEHIEIKNFGPSAVNLFDWWISANTELAYFTFGQVTLGPGQSCWVYTNQNTGINWCGSFESDTPIWDNTSDCGDLYNMSDDLMDHYCYP
jgi:endonuclease YncB( thermonuclease family)